MNVRAILIQGGVFVLLLVTWLQIRPKEESKEKDPLVFLPMERIEKIEIVKGDQKLVLERQIDPDTEQKRWVAQSVFGYPLPDGRVDEFINPLRQADLGEYLGSGLDPAKLKDSETLDQWGLSTDGRTQVRFYDAEDAVVEAIDLGRLETRDTTLTHEMLKEGQPPLDVEMPDEKSHHTFVLLPDSGEVRRVAAKLEASVDPKDWIDRKIVTIAEADRKEIDLLQYIREVPESEGLTAEYQGKPYRVYDETARLTRNEKAEPPKDGKPAFEWTLEVLYTLGDERGPLADRFGELLTVGADPGVRSYPADPTAVAGLLDALAGLEAEEFLEPVEYRGGQRMDKDHFTREPEIVVAYLQRGMKQREFRFGRLPIEAKAPPEEGAAPPPEQKGKPWCVALDTRSWAVSREQPFNLGSGGEEETAKITYGKVGVFTLDDWRYDSLTKEAFDFAKPEEGAFEDVPLAGTVSRDAVASVKVVVPEKKGEETTEKVLELKKDGETWTLASSWGYPAEAAKVGTLLDSIFGAQRARVRAKNPRLHKKFGLAAAERRRIVLADASGAELLALTLGKTDPFARIPDDKGEEKPTPTTCVLDADGKTVREFVAEIDPKTSPEDWVEKKLVSIPKFRIEEFDVVIDGKKHSFARRPGEHGDETKWVVVEAGGEIDAKKEPVDRLLDAAVDLQFDHLAEPVAWPEGQEAPDAAGLARMGLDHPTMVLVLHGREGIDEARALVFGKVETKKDGEEKDEDHGFGRAEAKHYVAVANFLGHAGSSEKAFAGSGPARALAVYEILEWTAERFEKPAKEYFEAEATHGLVRWKGAEGASQEVTRTKEEAAAFADKMVADQTLDGADATSGYTLTDDYWKTVYTLDVDQVGGPVETPAGYVVVKRTK